MFLWNLIAGSRMAQVAAGALVVIVIAFATANYLQNSAKRDLLLDLKEEELEKRERVNDATNSSPTDVDDAIDFLRDRR